VKKTRIKDIYIINNLFSSEEMIKIQECLNSMEWSKDEFSDNKYVDLGKHGLGINECQETGFILHEKSNLIQKNIEQDFNCRVGEEGMGTIVKYSEGWVLPYHADCWSNLPTYSGYPTRDISSVVYLTGDFEGGSLLFPDLDIEIEPLAGSAVYFPSDEKHMHTVTEVKSGNRATCTGFWHILKNENEDEK
jgi:predicted 2-oxoglutarate/Fe(II)-dependent dioxygenase YbiX